VIVRSLNENSGDTFTSADLGSSSNYSNEVLKIFNILL